MLGLAVCRLLPSRGERGLLLGCSMQAPHCGGFSCGAWALGDYSLVAARRLLTAVASPVARVQADSLPAELSEKLQIGGNVV